MCVGLSLLHNVVYLHCRPVLHVEYYLLTRSHRGIFINGIQHIAVIKFEMRTCRETNRREDLGGDSCFDQALRRTRRTYKGSGAIATTITMSRSYLQSRDQHATLKHDLSIMIHVGRFFESKYHIATFQRVVLAVSVGDGIRYVSFDF